MSFVTFHRVALNAFEQADHECGFCHENIAFEDLDNPPLRHRIIPFHQALEGATHHYVHLQCMYDAVDVQFVEHANATCPSCHKIVTLVNGRFPFIDRTTLLQMVDHYAFEGNDAIVRQIMDDYDPEASFATWCDYYEHAIWHAIAGNHILYSGELLTDQDIPNLIANLENRLQTENTRENVTSLRRLLALRGVAVIAASTFGRRVLQHQLLQIAPIGPLLQHSAMATAQELLNSSLFSPPFLQTFRRQPPEPGTPPRSSYPSPLPKLINL